MRIAQFLKSGRIRLNVIEKRIEIVDTQKFIDYESLNPSDWGYVFEKFVGQVLEDEGWEIDYHGLKNGFLDRGIDLIAYKNGAINAIQCKYVTSFISKSRIEWILYNASKLLDETCFKYPKNTFFTLIVSDIDLSFSKKKRKNFKLTFSDVSKTEYPLLQYFLDHNHVQDKIKLQFREIKMTR
jgi:hypothetical protein